jgi:NADPH2:quinone reductase
MREVGGPEVLVSGDAPDPEAGPGQVVVDVEAIGIPFVETQVRAGRGPGGRTPALPMVPGNAVGGVVSAVGPDVDAALLGRRVVTSTGGSGGYAERVAVAADLPIPVPDGLDVRAAVALLADGRTALGLVRAAGLGPGDRVLVMAAAGGVGTLLVQLAGAAGAAVVVGAAGGERKLDVVRSLGATVAVDYGRADWPDAVRAAGGVDVVFDGVGGGLGRAAFDLVERGGRYLPHGLASGRPTEATLAEIFARGITVIGGGFGGSPADLRALSADALAEAAAGRLRPTIGQTFPLERAAEAHAAIEARTAVGKTLLIP